jgi:phage host-nuclease inhibitor protein Gam
VEEVATEAQEYVELKQQVDAIDREEKQKIKQIKSEMAERRKSLVPRRDELLDRIQAWAETNRAGRKTISLPNGRKLEWRLPSSPRLVVAGQIIVIARLLLRLENWEKYVEIKLKKSNLKSDLDELHKKLRGLKRLLHRDNTEYFRVN